MRNRFRYYLLCEGVGCMATTDSILSLTVVAARRAAVALGWAVSSDDRDLCRRCRLHEEYVRKGRRTLDANP